MNVLCLYQNISHALVQVLELKCVAANLRVFFDLVCQLLAAAGGESDAAVCLPAHEYVCFYWV